MENQNKKEDSKTKTFAERAKEAKLLLGKMGGDKPQPPVEVDESKLTPDQLREKYHQDLQALAKVEEARQKTEQEYVAEEKRLKQPRGSILSLSKAKPVSGDLQVRQAQLEEIRKKGQENLKTFITIFGKLAMLCDQQQQYVQGSEEEEHAARDALKGKDLSSKIAFVQGFVDTPANLTANINTIQRVFKYEKIKFDSDQELVRQQKHLADAVGGINRLENAGKKDVSDIKDSRREYEDELKAILTFLIGTCVSLREKSADGEEGLKEVAIKLKALRTKVSSLYSESLKGYAANKDAFVAVSQKKKDAKAVEAAMEALAVTAKAKFRAMDVLDQIMFVEGLVTTINSSLAGAVATLESDYLQKLIQFHAVIGDVLSGRVTYLTGLDKRREEGEKQRAELLQGLGKGQEEVATVTVSEYKSFEFGQGLLTQVGEILKSTTSNQEANVHHRTVAAQKLLPIVTVLNGEEASTLSKKLGTNTDFISVRKELAGVVQDYELLMLALEDRIGGPEGLYTTMSLYAVDPDFVTINPKNPPNVAGRKVLKEFQEKQAKIEERLDAVKKKLDTLKFKLQEGLSSLTSDKPGVSAAPFTLPDDTGIPTLQFTLQDTHSGVTSKLITFAGLIQDFEEVQAAKEPKKGNRPATRAPFLQKLPGQDMVVLIDLEEQRKSDPKSKFDPTNPEHLARGKPMPEFVGKVGEKAVPYDPRWGIFEFASLAPRVKVTAKKAELTESKEQSVVKQKENMANEQEFQSSGLVSPDSHDGEDEDDRSERKASERPSVATSFDRPKTAATPVPMEVSGSSSPSSSQTTASSVVATPSTIGNKHPRASILGGLFNKKKPQPTDGGKPPVVSSSSQQRQSVSVNVKPSSSQPSVQTGSPAGTQAAMFTGASSTVTSSSSQTSASPPPANEVSELEPVIELEKDGASGQAPDLSSLYPNGDQASSAAGGQPEDPDADDQSKLEF